MFWGAYIPLEEAAELSGAHPNSLKRLLRQGVIRGKKKLIEGRERWMVEKNSLMSHFNPVSGYAFDRPGPRLFLTKADQASNTDTAGQYWVTLHDYGAPRDEVDYTVRCEPFMAFTASEAANDARLLYPKAVVVLVEKNDSLTLDDDGDPIIEF